MKTGKGIAIIFGITLVFALVFAGCEDLGVADVLVDAKEPVIVDIEKIPEEAVVYMDNGERPEPVKLRVTATSPDGGELSYVWFLESAF